MCRQLRATSIRCEAATVKSKSALRHRARKDIDYSPRLLNSSRLLGCDRAP